MSDVPNKIAELMDSETAVPHALKRAVAQAILRHKQLGNPIVVADEQGRIVWIPPEQIEVPPEAP